MPETPFLEFLARVAVALTATTVTVGLAVGLYRDRLRPRTLWLYAACVTAFASAWRWLIVLLALGDTPAEYAGLLIWVQPINAATLGVVIFTLGLIGLANYRGLR